MRTKRVIENAFKGVMYFSMCVVFIVKTFTVQAQSSRDAGDQQIISKVKAWEDSVRKLKKHKQPLYLGGELSLSVPQATLVSHVQQLNNMKVDFLGTNLGGIIANDRGKVKATAGLYYSGADVPYTIDMIQGAISTNLYLLRINKVDYHTFEPYSIVGFSYQKYNYYGVGLTTSEANPSQGTNYNPTDPPLAGVTGQAQFNLGAGVEYQLENNRNAFIHLFAEMTVGVPVGFNSSNASFVNTKMTNPMCISLGINVGIFK